MRLLRLLPRGGHVRRRLDGKVDRGAGATSAWPSCASCRTASPPARRDALIGATVEVLVDAPGVGRTHREAPEIDGIVVVPTSTSRSGSFAKVTVTGATGPDLEAA